MLRVRDPRVSTSSLAVFCDQNRASLEPSVRDRVAAVLFVWFGVFVFAHDWMYRMHGRWFKLSIETFDAIHYAGLSVYKIGILLLNLVPLVALYLVS